MWVLLEGEYYMKFYGIYCLLIEVISSAKLKHFLRYRYGEKYWPSSAHICICKDNHLILNAF